MRTLIQWMLLAACVCGLLANLVPAVDSTPPGHAASGSGVWGSAAKR